MKIFFWKTHLQRPLVIFLLSFIYVISATKLSAQSKLTENLKPDFSKVKELIQEQLINNKVPSISIAVIGNNKILWEQSFGLADKEHNIKASIYTSYYLASLSKTITATAVVQLSERKLINLDSPVNNYLKNSKVSSFLWNADSATIKKLINHTSGLTSFHRDCYLNEKSCPQSIDSAIQRYGIIFWKPGDHFDYSNLGYGILGKVVADVSNKSFESYLQTELFTPLGMRNSFLGTTLNHAGIAVRYKSDSVRSKSADMVSYTPGASSMYSSVDDLARFALLHLKDEIPHGKKVVSEKSISYMQSFITPTGGTNEFYGLGWDISSDFYGFKGVRGQGGTDDANAWLQLIPSENIAIVLLSNSGMSGDVSTSIINQAFSSVLPKFKHNLITYKKPPVPNQPISIPTSLYGTWQGKIHTYKKDISISLTFSKDGKNFAILDNKNSIEISKIEFNQRLFFNIPGDLDVEDTETTPYDMGFELAQSKNKLYGAITANAKAQLPFWLELNKISDKQVLGQ